MPTASTVRSSNARLPFSDVVQGARCGRLQGRPGRRGRAQWSATVHVAKTTIALVADAEVDEFGYLELDGAGAKLLFQIFTDREERRAIAVASNAPFSEWQQTFTDPRLCNAVVDRLTFNATILETGTDSYRLRTTTTTSRRSS